MKKIKVLSVIAIMTVVMVAIFGCLPGEIVPDNQSPIALFTATPNTGKAPLTVSFNGAASTDPDGEIWEYEWTIGNGTTMFLYPQVEYTYYEPGDYITRLKVTDNEGKSSVSESLAVYVTAADIVPEIEIIVSASEDDIEIVGSEVASYETPDGDIWFLIIQAKNVSVQTFSSVIMLARMFDSEGVIIGPASGVILSTVEPGFTYECNMMLMFILDINRVDTIEITEINT